MASHDGASSFVSSFTHDVFLSFRGPDTGNSFTAFLHKHLVKEGVDVYIDREDLRAGEEIKSALFKAIQGSKISIPVFSKGYADSRWCLDELVEIVRCHRDSHQIILPIFFDVNPADVRHQTGSFKTSFDNHKDRSDEQTRNNWKEALKEVATISGYDLGQVTGNQSKLVDLVVERVLSESSGKGLDDVKNPVGLNARVKEVEDRLCIGSDDVRFVGIWGIGGIGKTTIAKTLYNRIFKSFCRSCFLANIKGEEASNPKGLVHLQEQLIYSISRWKVDGIIGNVHRGRKLIIEKLHGENVLLILDDVDSRYQLDALAIESNWFGPASRIVITSRDKEILRFAKVDEDKIYCPQDLDDEESLRLFSLHAFSTDRPPEKYLQLSLDVINLAKGLPLTLEVLGCTFSDKENREEEVWKSLLQELKRIPHDDVYKKLKISYDNLKDNEKSIFLDAACLFVGYSKERLIPIWDACGFNPISAIKKLTQRNLLKFITKSDFREETYDELSMHDQIRAMGRGIVYEESPTEPSKRSRIWSREEILEAIEEPKGAQMLEVIHIEDFIPQPFPYTRNFAMMSNLRFLSVDAQESKGKFPLLPPNLRLFEWKGLLVPANFYHKKLVHMDLTESQIREAWTDKPQNENQRFQKLKVLNLEYCDVSHESLDFSWFPYLETLNLGSCKNMVNIHKSIGDLKSLVVLNLRRTEIEELPNSICSLSSLKVLNLSMCTSLKNLPQSIGDLKALVKLDLEMTKIEEIPNSICNLSFLEVLNLYRCSSLKNLPDSIGDLKSLVKLDLGGTSFEEIPSSICKLNKEKIKEVSDGVWLLENLEVLALRNCHNLVKLPISWGRTRCLRIIDLTGTRILLPRDDSVILLPSLVELKIGNNLESSLPPWISGLPQLQHLELGGYTKLVSVLDLPSTLTSLTIVNCISLQTLPDLSSLKHLRLLSLTRCEELKEIQGIEKIESLNDLTVCKCKTLTNTGRWKIHGQGILLVDKSQRIDNYSFLNVNDVIDKGLILCVVFDLQSVQDIVEEGKLVDIFLIITANIRRRQKHRWICCCINEVVIEGVEYSSKRDIIYLHHFKGFDWFGIPLEPGFDAIRVPIVYGQIKTDNEEQWPPMLCKVKFWKLLLESTASEQQQKISKQEEEESITTTARRMVADFFNWSDDEDDKDDEDDEDDEDHGRSHHFVPTQQVGSSTHKTTHQFISSSIALEIEGSNPVVPQQANEESSNEIIDSQCDLELQLGLTNQGEGQAGRVAEDPNLSQQALGLSPERLWRAGKRPRFDMDDAGPSGAL